MRSSARLQASSGRRSPKTLHGQVTVSARVTAAPMLALSSTARTRTPRRRRPVLDVACSDQAVVPVAGCQVAPPSVETSTPATTPPPVSAAVPVTVTDAPLATAAPAAGAVIATVGPAVSVDLVAASGPPSGSSAGRPCRRSRLTWACCIRASAGSAAYGRVVLLVEAPGPLDGAGAEDERTAGRAVHREVVGRRARRRPCCRSRAGTPAIGPVVVDSRIRPGGREPLSMVLVGLVADGVRSQRACSPPSSMASAGVAPQPQLALGRAHRDREVA